MPRTCCVWDGANARKRAVGCEMLMHEVMNGSRTWLRLQKAGELSWDFLRTFSRLGWQDGSLAVPRHLPEAEVSASVQTHWDDIEVRTNNFRKLCVTSGADREEEPQSLR